MTLSRIFLIFTISGFCIYGPPAIAKSPAAAYKDGVQCVGFYDFSLSMTPLENPKRAEAENLRAAWYAYAKTANSAPPKTLDMDIAKAQSSIRSAAMGGDRDEMQRYFTPVTQRCGQMPPQPAMPAVSNPFKLKAPSALKTYAAAVQCAGRYVVDESNEGPTYLKFKALARSAAPEITDAQYEADLVTTTTNYMNMLITSDLNSFAALKTQCDTAAASFK